MPSTFTLYYISYEKLLSIISRQNSNFIWIIPFQNHIHITIFYILKLHCNNKLSFYYILKDVGSRTGFSLTLVIHINKLIKFWKTSIGKTKFILSIGYTRSQSLKSRIFPFEQLHQFNPCPTLKIKMEFT